MKQQLDAETRAAMVDYRLERAHSTLGEADLLYGGGYFNAAVNLLYYLLCGYCSFIKSSHRSGYAQWRENTTFHALCS